jgi:hypothetical protein
MTDYYPIVARAVASLPKNTEGARREVYQRARNALVKQLSGGQREPELMRERQSLEEAISKIEAETAAQSKDTEPNLRKTQLTNWREVTAFLLADAIIVAVKLILFRVALGSVYLYIVHTRNAALLGLWSIGWGVLTSLSTLLLFLLFRGLFGGAPPIVASQGHKRTLTSSYREIGAYCLAGIPFAAFNLSYWLSQLFPFPVFSILTAVIFFIIFMVLRFVAICGFGPTLNGATPIGPTLSTIATALGVAGNLLMAGSIVARLVFGSNRLGMTDSGAYLLQHGVPLELAKAMDFGDSSAGMAVASLLGLVAMTLGLVAIFRKQEMSLAVIGIVTGSLVGVGPFLLPLVL